MPDLISIFTTVAYYTDIRMEAGSIPATTLPFETGSILKSTGYRRKEAMGVNSDSIATPGATP